jgi:hypothetical protein
MNIAIANEIKSKFDEIIGLKKSIGNKFPTKKLV